MLAHFWHTLAPFGRMFGTVKTTKNPVFAIENRVFDESKPYAALTASIIRRSMP
jgi:hypothetical protein